MRIISGFSIREGERINGVPKADSERLVVSVRHFTIVPGELTAALLKRSLLCRSRSSLHRRRVPLVKFSFRIVHVNFACLEIHGFPV